MCLMLYLAAQAPVPEIKNDDISVEAVEEQRTAVSRWFSLPEVRFIGAPGCSCTFPHVEADAVIEWYDGFFDDDEERGSVLASVRALFQLVDSLLSHSPEVQLYPVWDGDEAESPKGTIDLNFGSLDPERFFFNERFFYRITSPAAAV
jgi:hypothetical protein